MKTLQFPLSKITITFVLGILFSFYANPTPKWAFFSLFLGIISFCLAFYRAKKDFVQKIYFGVLVYIIFFFVGIATQVIHADYFKKDHYIHKLINQEKIHILEVVLKERLKPSLTTDRYVAELKRLDNQKSSGKILINYYKPKGSICLEIGSKLQIASLIVRNLPPKNPGQFDYSNYLRHQNIPAQVYFRPEALKISKKQEHNLNYYSDQLRTRILGNLKKAGFRTSELNVVAALILGQQQDISPEIVHDYQFAGAVHILSVSGLHLGFILLFLNFLLRTLPKNKFNSYTKLLIIITSLWCFALLAGLSPSVIRSVAMFSFVAIGLHLKRKTNVFHTLLVSIFLILLFEPAFVFDVGFQLSYISLFFILWLQPILSSLWLPKNKISTYIWDILTVSFAAQIGAFPLSIYYFHQFPTLFFVTNLIILPGLGFIMALGVLVMVIAAFNFTPYLPIKILEETIRLLNGTINWVASFEQFIIQDIALNSAMLLSLYLLIILTIQWFEKPNYFKMTTALGSIILFQLAYYISLRTIENEQELIVFNQKQQTIIGCRFGKKLNLYSAKPVFKNKMIQSYLVDNFSRIVQQNPLRNVLYFNNKHIYILDSTAVYPNKIKADLLIITKSPQINIERLLHQMQPKIVVADESNYKSDIDAWEASCRKEKIPFHATAEKGFYRLK